MIDLNQFRDWQAERPESRSISINIDRIEGRKIWVYDYAMRVGQHVQSVDEIDLEGTKDAEEKAEFERLRAKYEGVQG